jgi:hypothetical protein
MNSSYTALASWIAAVHPEIFKMLYAQAAQKPVAAGTSQMGDLSDFFSGVGDTFSNAVSSVGDYLSSSQGISTLASLGTAYLNSQSSQNVLQTQVARAQAAQPPAPITYTQNAQGQLIPVIGSGVATVAVTPQILQSLTPASVLSKYGLYIAGGVGLLAILLLLNRK